MMNFRTAKAAVVQILGENANGQFRVAGYQPQVESAAGSVNTNRICRVFFQSGDFPKSGSGMHGPIRHEITMEVILVASMKAKVDLSVLENPLATAAARSTALLASQNAADLADQSFDELAELVYQILMDNRYMFLDTSEDIDGSEDLDMSNRWVGRITKDDPDSMGELVTITGSMTFTFTMTEELTGADVLSGEDPVETGAVSVDILVNNDTDEGRAGVTAP